MAVHDRAAGRPNAVVLGCAGLELTDAEHRFFSEANPLGLILFQRNCETPDQVRALVARFRDVVGDSRAPVLIDQEGGRVQRLKPPYWRKAPSQQLFASADAGAAGAGLEAAYLNARLIAGELADLGITVNCLPCVDVPNPGADGIIGDRASGRTPKECALFGEAAIAGLMDGGVLPVIKHIPGHGRAKVDSHLGLPVVNAQADTLRRCDFPPFQALKGAAWAMTAHVVYSAFDADRPATLSSKVINGVIRGEIGFDGVLVSDDLSMRALSGDFRERTRQALDAGCDAVLHCNGGMDEMAAVMRGVRPLSDAAMLRLERAEKKRTPPKPFDHEEALCFVSRFMDAAKPKDSGDNSGAG